MIQAKNTAQPASPLQKLLLICGIASSLLYTAMLVFLPARWYGYNSASQTINELSAVDAPTKLLWATPALIYTVLVTIFGWSVLKSARGNRNLHRAGIFILIYGLIGLVWPIAPMHQREFLAEWGGTITDTLHLILGAITVFLMTAAIAFATAAFGKRFRIYSVFTVLVLVVFGILTSLEAPKLKSNQPTPLLGVWERISIGIFLLWIVVLAFVLLRHNRNKTIKS